MPERMQNSDEWNSKFVRNLPGPYRCFWFWLKQFGCNHSGIWEIDFELAKMRTHPDINEAEAEELFKDKVLKLDCGEKWFIVDYIQEQQKTTSLNFNNTYHRGMIIMLAQYGLVDLEFNVLKEQNTKNIKPLESLIKEAKLKVKLKVKVIVNNKDAILKGEEIEKNSENEVNKETVYQSEKVSNADKKQKATTGPNTFNTPLVQAFREFKEMRVKKRAPLTPRAAELIHMELKKLAGDNEELKISILNQSVANSWTDVYALKEKSTNNQQAAKSKTENIINIATAATYQPQA